MSKFRVTKIVVTINFKSGRKATLLDLSLVIACLVLIKNHPVLSIKLKLITGPEERLARAVTQSFCYVYFEQSISVTLNIALQL